MAQWDVHANPTRAAREQIPYLVVVQSDLLDRLPTRLVVPLSRSSASTLAEGRRLAPQFRVAGEQLRLKPHEAGAVPARALGRAVASLRGESHRIIDAIDAVISGV